MTKKPYNPLKKKEYALILLTVLVILVFFTALGNTIPPNNGENPSIAQLVWQKTYGGIEDDRAFHATKLDEGYLIVGSTKSFIENSTVAIALWTDLDGNLIFNKTYPEEFGTEIRYATHLSDGFLLVGNIFSENGDINGLILRTNKTGEILWKKTIDGYGTNKLFSAILSEKDESVILLGTTTLSSGHITSWATKLDMDGQAIWDKNYQLGINSCFRAGVLAPDGNYIITGYSEQPSGDYDLLITKIDHDGKLLWERTNHQADGQKAFSIVQAIGGYLIVGDSQSLGSDTDGMTTKIDWDGNILWTKNFGGKAADSAATIVRSVDGNYLVGGFTFSFGAGNRDLWLFKITDSGDILWSCVQGDEAYQEVYQVIEAEENQYVLFGWTDPINQKELLGEAKYDFNIAKISPKNIK